MIPRRQASALAPFIDGPLSDDRPAARSALKYLGQMKVSGTREPEDGAASGSTSREFTVGGGSPLFDYQQEVVDAVQMLIGNRRPSGMVSIPTGGGKTRTALWLLWLRMAEHALHRVLWLAPSVELLEQAAEALVSLWGQHSASPKTLVRLGEIGAVNIGASFNCVVTFATVQMAIRRHDAIAAYAPEIVVYDEAHQSGAPFSRRLIRMLRSDVNAFVLGLSATPGRSTENESEALAAMFGGNLIAPRSLGADPVGALRAAGVLSDVEFMRIPLPGHWDDLRVRALDRRAPNVDELAVNSARFWAVVDAVRAVAAERCCLVFGASIAHCVALEAALGGLGISVGTIDYSMDAVRRREAIDRFRSGALRVLLNKNILSAGFDMPRLEDLVMATPVRSPIMWEQIVGRVSRGPAVGGTAVGRIWELDDHVELHDKVLAAQRYDGTIW